MENASLARRLIGACVERNIGQVRELIAAGADPDEPDAQGNSPLLTAILNDITIVQVLIGARANVNLPAGNNVSPLHFAVIQDRADFLDALIKAGAKVNAQDSNGDTPLHYAIVQRHGNAVKALIAAGANIRLQNARHISPLQMAIETNNTIFMLAVFKEHELKTDAYCKEDTPTSKDIFEAIKADDIVSIKKLIAADPRIVDKHGEAGVIPLQFATEHAHIDFVRELLAAGAKIDLHAPWLKDKPVIKTFLIEQREYVIANTLASGTHKRVGNKSPLALLSGAKASTEILQKISRLTVEAEKRDAQQTMVPDQQPIQGASLGCVIC